MATEAIKPTPEGEEPVLDKDHIYVSSLFGANTGQPAVSMVVQGYQTQMSPAKAKEVAGMLLGAAEAALGDAFFFTFVTERIGAETYQAVGLLQEFRQWRIDHKSDEVES